MHVLCNRRAIIFKADLTIIIPTLNEAEYIEETLNSACAQRGDFSFEVIVCDGGSRDNTVEIARQYAKVIISPKRGTAQQLAFAASFAVRSSNWAFSFSSTVCFPPMSVIK